MTFEEIQERLKELGINAGEWGETVPGERTSPFMERQSAALEKVRDLLQGQVDRDKAKIAELLEQKSRLEHGGGS